MYDDKPYMNEDIPYMYDIIQICMNDKPDMYDDMPYVYEDMPDMYDDMTDMYEYHIHVWYHVAWGVSLLRWIAWQYIPADVSPYFFNTYSLCKINEK